jgi:hypothetical protein
VRLSFAHRRIDDHRIWLIHGCIIIEKAALYQSAFSSAACVLGESSDPAKGQQSGSLFVEELLVLG